MTIIVFLVDTSSSMCQKCYVNGVQKTFLDIAKGAVETFLKYRQRSQDCLGDRYMLLSFEDPPNNIKAGWKENHATLMNELKNLQCNGLTSMGEALKNAFDLLNLNRTQTGIDTYGQGRCPFYVEPSVIIVITDGGRYTYRTGVYQETELLLPLNTQIPGSKFTKEPFRWDQRLFSLVLRIPGNKVEERLEGKVPHDNSPIEKMCEVTGGRSYRIKSQFVLNQCIESLVQKVQPGVVLQFEPQLTNNGELAPLGANTNSSGNEINFQPTKKMIYVQKFPSQPKYPVGYWPIPEPYWPDPKATTLPPRDAHPKIRITSTYIDEPQVIRNFPVDKYEVEASPLTQQILSKREINKCWHVIVPYGIHGFEAPFGYIKASPNFCQVHLYVLSYNFPVLLPLLNELVNKYSMSPPNEWIYRFSSYTRSIPQYYCPFLRRALQNILVPYTLLSYILPESMDNYLNPGVANYLKQIKNTAKQDQENLCLRVYKQVRQPKPPYRPIEIAKLNCGQALRRDLVRNPLLRDTFSKLHSEITTYENYTIFVPTMNKQQSAKSYRNPFDIPRRELIEEISRMRENFLRVGKGPPGSSLTSKDVGHRLPIAEMGNYQEYLRNRQTPLRELEQTNVRQHMFGNPYKKDKHMVMIDEAELDNDPMIKQQQNPMKKMEQSTRMRSKRKAGPIRKDFIFRRSSTDSRSSQDSLGSLVRCNNGISLSSMSTNSDVEMSDTESCMSDTSSIMSDDSDADRLVFDFTEPSEDFPINGHVRNFINGGDFDDGDEPHHPTTAPPPLQTNGNGVLTPPLIVGPGMYNPIPEAPPSPAPSPQLSLFTNHLQNGITTTPPLQPIIPPPSTATFHHMTSHNDINDAQEISRILQQCHNGTVVPEPVKPVENNVAPVAPEPMIEEESGVDEPKSDEEEEMTEEQMDKVKQNNTEARTTIFKDIRRPGRNYSILLDHLGLVKGDYETRFNFIQMCITEALRFRRKKMADCIEEWWAKHHSNHRQHVS